jgi:phosphoribosylglycinamide formyltransferase-1
LPEPGQEQVMPKKIKIGVLASGGGTNLQAIIDNCKSGKIAAEVAVVISDVHCGALERARRAGIPEHLLNRHDTARFPSREAFDTAVLERLEQHHVDLVCLAGYMRILTHELVDPFAGRMMNIHPALLPAFGGKGMWGHHVHEAVLEYGCRISGCTVHFVSLETDAGPIILQRAVPVQEDDTPDTLAARILPHEHELYSQAIQLFAEGRLKIEGRRARILPPTGR